ncbi:hypothetical protein C8Q74DRAFT_928868 [Fomes fomentarius]|nr:hypothetical protein C8Q74DRAFT_928868 [Fomes fomentarius]
MGIISFSVSAHGSLSARYSSFVRLKHSVNRSSRRCDAGTGCQCIHIAWRSGSVPHTCGTLYLRRKHQMARPCAISCVLLGCRNRAFVGLSIMAPYLQRLRVLQAGGPRFVSSCCHLLRRVGTISSKETRSVSIRMLQSDVTVPGKSHMISGCANISHFCIRWLETPSPRALSPHLHLVNGQSTRALLIEYTCGPLARDLGEILVYNPLRSLVGCIYTSLRLGGYMYWSLQ